MGKQTAVALTESDEKAFLAFLRATADVRLLAIFAPTVDALWVDDLGVVQNGEWQFYIWNTAFPWVPRYGTVTNDESGRHNGWRFVCNTSDAPLIEYSRHNFENPEAANGRLYWSKYFSAPNGLRYDVAEFERWYARVIRWVRKHGRQQEKGTLNTYYLPDAWARREQR